MLRRFFAISTLSLLLAVAVLHAGVPSEFTYQGRIREAGQQKSGTYTMNFKIYSDGTAGTCLWESHNQTVLVTNGMFSYRMSPDTIDWRTKDLYLETVLNNTVLSPREKLTSHFFAFNSASAENISSTSTVTITVGSTPRMAIDTTGEVKNLVGATTFYMVPRGAIIMWSGLITNIPDGWHLCDGTNGTPNLFDRFILSVPDASTNPGESGGSTSLTIATANLPAHSHVITISGVGDHSHGVIDPGHSHAIQAYGRATLVTSHIAVSGDEINYQTVNTDLATTGISLSGAGGHTHSAQCGDTGSGTPLSFLPKYYKLAFIMKL